MTFNNPLLKRFLIRLVLLTLTIFVWAIVVVHNESTFLGLIFLVLTGVQLRSFFKEQAANEISINRFLEQLKNKEIDFEPEEKNEELKQQYKSIISTIKDRQKEKEAEYQYFRNIVQHVGIGIITFNKSGEIQLYNFAAKKLLNTSYQVHNIQQLTNVSEELVDTFKELKTGGSKLIQVNIGEESRQLSVYAIELQLHDKHFKLVSLQNIQTELDEKEMEAWRNLIRVLTHEIMNSVTPISSLTGTTREMLSGYKVNGAEEVPIQKDDMEDLMYSLKTIESRSEGLIRFLNEFRNLTHTPTPKLKNENINVLLEGISLLMSKELKGKSINVHKSLDERIPEISIDRELIEQVIINLVKNASESFDSEQEEKNIWISSNLDNKKRVVISVKDDGAGIEPEALTKIFIPFFTTKKNGSGIGLSLSKEIVRKHQGNISVQSTLGVGTEFVLKF
ncbi:histidine kinase [Marivirga tractuosa]|uniref:histidine kinase n=1 Tax=Marivirga tractuosa (strain ATCC 23168 / DSM 4126 / NBRC 15989 / NCIMB 1408 / VKM B-1430 / H-43) TaxID=643867 RepID=E4TSM6_MARTH|nr:histidine kinase [Marivirga tractuosa DSM 4126]BDD13706.1 histidine kinase [Marivirga tractuosa]